MNLLSPQERSDYERDGFIIVRNLFSGDEISLLGQTARADNAMDKSSSSMDATVAFETSFAFVNRDSEDSDEPSVAFSPNSVGTKQLSGGA